MAAAAVDVGYLAASYSVPESSLHALLAEPTVALVQTLLVQIEARARELDDLRSDNIKADVELEAAVQSGDSRARALKATADQAQKEADSLREKLAAEEDTRRQVEAELHTLTTTASSSTDEVQALTSRIKTLESQNRDTLAMHDAKVAAHDRLAQELADQHAKFVDVRKQLAALDEAKQQLENAAANVKFRETNFQQEIELLRKNNEWFEGELKTRADDHTRYRKEKSAQVAELQRAAADAAESMDTLRRSETALRQRVDELEQKADEARARIEQLEDEAAQNQASFRNELDSARRLATLHQESAELVKGRLQQLQQELATMSDNAAEEIGQLQAEVESERNKVAEAEMRIAELESIQETLEAQISELNAASASASASRPPATPRRGMNSSFDTPGRAGSPAVFSPGGSRLKGGMSITQLYADNVQLKAQIRTLHEKSEDKDATLAEMLETLEQVQPEIDELRRENEVLTSQTTEMSTLLDEATGEREAARKDARKALGDLEGTNRECAMLRQQLQDTATQMRSLLWRRQADDEGLQSLTPEQQEFVKYTAEHNNEIPEHLIDENTATGALITRHLLLFSNVSELQAANQQLMRTIREVAETHEGREARDKMEQYKKDEEELNRLRSQLAESEEQIKSLTLRSQSFMKERDMYRRIVTNRGHTGSDGVVDFGRSVDSRAPATPMRGSLMQSMDQTPHSRDVAGYEKLIKDLQSHLDLLREENATDRASLKQQVDSLTKESNQLQSDKLRLDNQVRREQDRYSHLEGNMKMLQSEKTTLQERYSAIQDALAKQDDRVDKAQQDALDAGARAEGLEREIVNLKASQTMWKTIEARLTERNKELTDERDRLSKMVTDIQSLRNEQELTNAENRRRLQDRVDSLEVELQIAQRKLEDEVAEHKKTAMQREYERGDAQRRIDDFIKAKNETEVKFASANTARQQLEQRVSELQTQVQSAEERAESLRPRQVNASNEGEDDASPEDDLEAQVSELQRKIERKQEDLEVAQGQIETFQAIAQEAEDQLRSYTETHERYEEETTLAQEEKDATIKDLQQRVEEISSELAMTNTELTELRGQHEQETLRLTQQKDSLEADIARLKEDVNEYKAEVDNQSQLVASQAEIATRAQQDYEHELAKHGETMKSLRNLRDEHNQLKTDIAQFKAQAEAAQASLAQNEEHWASVREQSESQIAEMQRNYDGAKQHNKTLLRQFDEFKAQIDALKSNRATASAGETEGATDTTGSSGLQEIVDYLRREKEILEVQLNLKDQEVRRQEQQLSHAQSQLDQTREKLIAEQTKSQGPQSGSSLQSLQAQIEQLNVYRESTTTLRNENRRLEAQLSEKATEMEDMHNKLEPLQARVAELEGEVELHLGHLKAVEEDRDRWQKRHQDVLQRYDRIDPKELEDLKKQLEDLQSERDQAVGQLEGLNEKIEASDTTLEAAVNEAKKAATLAARQDAKDRFNKLHNQKMAIKQAEIDGLIKERDEAQESLASVRQELETARQQVSGTQSDASQSQEQLTALQQELEQAKSQLAMAQQELEAAKSARDEALTRTESSGQATTEVDMGEEGQVNEGSSDASVHEVERLKAQLTEAKNKENVASNQAASLHVQLTFAKDRITELEKAEAEHMTRIAELGGELKEAQTKAQAPQPEPSADPTPAPVEEVSAIPASDEIEKLKEELAVAKKEVEDLRTRAETAESAIREKTTNSEALPNEEQFNATKAMLEEREARVAQLEATLQQREAKVTVREGKQAQFLEKCNNKIKEIRAETNQELERLKTEHQTEVERVRQTQTVPTNNTPATPATPSAPSQSEDMFAGATSDAPIDTESLPRPTATLQQFSSFVKSNNGVKHLLQGLVSKNVDAKTRELTKQVDDLKQALKALNSEPVQTSSVKEESANSGSQIGEELAKSKAEHEQALKTALEAKEASLTRAFKLKSKLFEGQFSLLKVRWAVFEKAAKTTPTEEVGKVYEIARVAKDTPTAQPNTPSKPQPPTPGQSQPSAQAQTPRQTIVPGQQQTPVGAPGTPQTNGANAPAQALPIQAVPGQQPNPFQQSDQGTAAPNPFMQVQNQLGRGSAPGSGIVAPNQQQQPAGRGRGEHFGTGPRALQSIVGAQGGVQSGIPRGGMGSGIPLPGGRGGGRGQPLQPLQTAGQLQGIPRGGGRGGGRGTGRGGQNSAQPSPRLSLNPGAAGFQPVGAGRGQKRNAEDDAEGGGARGGKRARGGRGGAGGAGGAPAAE